MIISHSQKFIYIPIPKTATTKLRMELSRLCEPGDIITPIPEDNISHFNPRPTKGDIYLTDRLPWFQFKPTNGPFVDAYGFTKRLTTRVNISVIFDIFGEEVLDYKIIGSERNPFDRLISRYLWNAFSGDYYQGNLGSKQQQAATLLNDRDAFQEFVKLADYHLAEGHDFYTLGGANVADFIVRQEHFTEDLRKLEIFLGAFGEFDLRTRIKAMPRGDDALDQTWLFDGIEDLVRARFLRTFEFMGYGGLGSDCPEFVPHENRHQVKRRYVDRYKNSSLTSGWRHTFRMKYPGTFAIATAVRRRLAR